MKELDDKKAGTRVRAAGFSDALAIFRQIKAHPDELVPRPISDIVANIDRFFVAEDAEGRIVGTVAYLAARM